MLLIRRIGRRIAKIHLFSTPSLIYWMKSFTIYVPSIFKI
jgi:hypothetical protein